MVGGDVTVAWMDHKYSIFYLLTAIINTSKRLYCIFILGLRYVGLRPSIIGMGNPGVGKSAILNALAEEIIFKSGPSFGPGLTYQLDVKSRKGRKYIDTPGLADNKRRKDAGRAISTALKEGGSHKILFVSTTNAGRVNEQDVTTMRLILDAAPEIGARFGIVINMVPTNIMKGFRNSENLNNFKTALFANFKDEHIHDNILFLQKNDKLDGESDKLLDINEYRGYPKDLRDFVENLPEVNLTKDRAKDVNIEMYNEIKAMVEKMNEKMEQDKEFYIREQERRDKQISRLQEENDRLRKDVQENRHNTATHECQMPFYCLFILQSSCMIISKRLFIRNLTY